MSFASLCTAAQAQCSGPSSGAEATYGDALTVVVTGSSARDSRSICRGEGDCSWGDVEMLGWRTSAIDSSLARMTKGAGKPRSVFYDLDGQGQDYPGGARSAADAKRLSKPPSEFNTALADFGICPTAAGVVLPTGESTLPQTDYQSGGLYGLAVTRLYRSQGSGSGRFFGPNWVSNYDPARAAKSTQPCINTEVGCIPRDVTVTFADGSR